MNHTKQIDKSQLTKSISTICEALDYKVGSTSSIDYVKQAVSIAISEELKSLIHGAAEDIRLDSMNEIERLKNVIREKDDHIAALEQIICELQTFYRAKGDKAVEEESDMVEHHEITDIVQTRTFLSRFFKKRVAVAKQSSLSDEISHLDAVN